MAVIVFHADDLGLSPGANAGVAAAIATGLVRETSLHVVGPHAEAGAAVARAAADRVGAGLHLAFTEGRPLSGPIPGLTRRDGTFPPLRRLLLACAAGRPDRAAVRREIEAQIDRLEALGVSAGHVDGHHHVHAFPVLRDALAEVVRDRGIGYVRMPVEATRGRRPVARRLLARLSRGLAVALAAAEAPARSLPFVGLSLYGRRDYAAAFEATLARLPVPDVEFMVHPREADPALAAELTFLTDPELPARLESRGFALGRYADLPSPS